MVPPLVAADAGYGQVGDFRHKLALHSPDFAVAVRGDEIAHAGNEIRRRSRSRAWARSAAA
ncbi:hypothetical protein [Embleya sp. NPDC059259]|uniref:hypothetical protein n=1 Tax=unclassified Embleya TaxID=2699296 RepID=UPI00367EBCFB